jgi:hypothetical protein
MMRRSSVFEKNPHYQKSIINSILKQSASPVPQQQEFVPVEMNLSQSQAREITLASNDQDRQQLRSTEGNRE